MGCEIEFSRQTFCRDISIHVVDDSNLKTYWINNSKIDNLLYFRGTARDVILYWFW